MPSHTGYSRFIRFIHFAGDVLLLNISFVLAFYLRFDNYNLFNNKEYSSLLFFFNICWVLIIYLYDVYAIYRITHITKVIRNVINSIFFHLLLTLTLYIFLFHYDPSRLQLLYTYGLFIVFVVVWRLFMIKILKSYRKRGRNFRNIVIIGKNSSNSEIYNFIKSDSSYGFIVKAFFDDNLKKIESEDTWEEGSLDRFKYFCLDNKIDELFLILTDLNSDRIFNVITFAENHMIRIKIIPDFSRHIFKQVEIDFYGNIPVLVMRKEPLEKIVNRMIKRVFDIIFSSLVIVLVFTWLFPIIAIIIKLSSPGPVFFKQKRTGKGDKVFTCLKFRSMHVNKDSDSVQAVKDDPRLSKIGSFLRKTSMDEFPQFFNVLYGEMSVIGPRPHMLKHTEEYSEFIDRYMVRHFIKPGITGWAQVNGYRGETKNSHMMKKRVQYDVWYIENWSVLLEIKIIYLTVLNFFKGEKNAF